jgi:exopolyphosphatase / guanosine-5'-triphosphate,3'-diphosphate pyrophosphatase
LPSSFKFSLAIKSTIMRFGVIDCGTNTFHLHIVEADKNGGFKTIYKERVFVKLGAQGLDRIGNSSFQRGVDCLFEFRKKLDEYQVEKFRAFGTETFRRAANGLDFVNYIRKEIDIDIQIISGEEEARFIQLGVMQAVPAFSGKGLIMDIGGGSVEFIIANQEKVFWAKSFPIGVQVLFSSFQKNDPISTGDLFAIEHCLENELQPLFDALHGHETPFLIGASGSFEVIEALLVETKPHPLYSIIGVQEYYPLYYKFLKTSLSQRLQMPELPPERAELIIAAFVLIDFIIRKAGIRQIITSAYAMKEGALREMIMKL